MGGNGDRKSAMKVRLYRYCRRRARVGSLARERRALELSLELRYHLQTEEESIY